MTGLRLPRLGCLGWSLLLVGLGALSLVCGWCWYLSEGDIRAKEAQARLAGVPTTWDGFHELHATPRQSAAWRDLHVLATRPQPSPAKAATEEFWRSIHAAAERAGQGTILDGSALSHADLSKTQDILLMLLVQRAQTVERPALPALIADMVVVGTATATREPGWGGMLAAVTDVTEAVRPRLSGLRGSAEGRLVAAVLDDLRTRVRQLHPLFMRWIFLQLLAEARSRPSLDLTAADGIRGALVMLSDALAWRWNRAGLLQESLDHLRAVDATADRTALAARVSAIPVAPTALPWTPWEDSGTHEDILFRPEYEVDLADHQDALRALDELIDGLAAGSPPVSNGP